MLFRLCFETQAKVSAVNITVNKLFSCQILIISLGHPFLIPRIKNADDEMIPVHAKSLDDSFLDVLQLLDYPPAEDDRLNIKLRLFSKQAAWID